MTVNLQLTSLTFILVIITTILYLIRKGRITVNYSLVLFFCSLILIIFTVLPHLLTFISDVLGFEIGSNMIFAGLIGMLMCINIALTVIISGQNNKIRLLIQEVSMLKKSSKR